jgi:hypothetical protein
MTMKNNRERKNIIVKRNTLLAISGIIIGAAGGFMYYYFIGCRTGTCPITSSPWISTLWGAAVGYLLFDMFRKKKNQETRKEDIQS